MPPKWEKIIDYWQDVELRHALTFPFLIGAQREPTGSKYGSDENLISDITLLLSQVSSSERDNLYYKIYRCPDLESLVIRKVVDSLPDGIAIFSPSGNQSPMLYISDVFESTTSATVAEVAQKIWNESGSAMLEGRYSRRGKRYGYYNEFDINIIRKATAE